MKEKETVVATLPIPAAPAEEQKLGQEITEIELRAEGFKIMTDADYTEAAEFGKELKRKSAQVVDFFKPMKDSAHKAHKAICDREKSFLKPLANAERIIKKTMGDYVQEQERKRRETEEAMRRAAEAERERKLWQAAMFEADGKAEEAEETLTEAVVMDDAARFASAAVETPKIQGVGTKKDWEIVEVDDGKVPVVLAGMMIRPVDHAAVMRLIRASKGKIEIPGVTYRETTKMTFRG